MMLSHLQRKQTLHTSGVHLHFHHRIPLFHPGNGWSLRRRHYTGCSGQCSLRFLQCDIPAVPDSPLRLLQLPESRDKIKLQHRWCQFLIPCLRYNAQTAVLQTSLLNTGYYISLNPSKLHLPALHQKQECFLHSGNGHIFWNIG